jgi:molybdopterin-guanine dinucleotide biosynthesis protein A
MTSPDRPPADIGAIVLAGGRSSRFGRDKLAEPIDGRPLLDHAIAAVQLVASDVVVVVAPDADRPVPVGVRIVRDEVAFQGPLAGLAVGLAALADTTASVIVVGGDMPALSPAVLRVLLAGLLGPPRATVVVLDEGGPMPMGVDRSSAADIARDLLAAGERRLRALPERAGATVIPSATWRALDPTAETLRDIDRPSDLSP